MVIDSHVHFWKYERTSYGWIDKSMKTLQKDYLPADIKLTLERNNIDGCIAVQSIPSLVETRFLAELAKTNTFIKAVIGWADLQSDHAEKHLSELQQYGAI
ncbi:MAG: amidohydrolase, partial [Chitinophagaceae bacterium]|nr:amidohydrolase [Chitinophagaceae bacterium]